MSVPRYYAQCTTPDKEFACSWSTAWQVFDRQLARKGGEVMAIALCSSWEAAFKIRDKLNASETSTEK